MWQAGDKAIVPGWNFHSGKPQTGIVHSTFTNLGKDYVVFIDDTYKTVSTWHEDRLERA